MQFDYGNFIKGFFFQNSNIYSFWDFFSHIAKILWIHTSRTLVFSWILLGFFFMKNPDAIQILGPLGQAIQFINHNLILYI